MKGTVCKWILGKGFGFIKTEGSDDDYWVHHTDIKDGNRLEEGEEVTFDESPVSHKKGSKTAVNVSGKAVRKNEVGSLTGKVKSWKPERGFGFASTDDGKDVYVHFSSFGGGRLLKGETLTFDLVDVNHKTGRYVAMNVSGPAIKPRGECTGKVKSWHPKGYGFISREGDDTEYFCHVSELDGGYGMYLSEGKEVYFDIEDGKDDKKMAVNVTGPALYSEDPYEHQMGGGRGAPVGRGGGGRGGGGRGGGMGGMGGGYGQYYGFWQPPPSAATRAKRKQAAAEGKRVIVGNLAFSVTWHGLKDHFKTAGNVEHADVFQDPMGRSKGTGVVEFSTADEASAAIKSLNDTELRGRKIWVREDRDTK